MKKSRKYDLFPSVECLEGRKLLSMAVDYTKNYYEGSTGTGAMQYISLAGVSDSNYMAVDDAAWTNGNPSMQAYIYWGDGPEANAGYIPEITIDKTTNALQIKWPGMENLYTEGSVEESPDGGLYDVTAGHRYLASGTYNIEIVFIDSLGDSITANTTATVKLTSDGGNGGGAAISPKLA